MFVANEVLRIVVKDFGINRSENLPSYQSVQNREKATQLRELEVKETKVVMVSGAIVVLLEIVLGDVDLTVLIAEEPDACSVCFSSIALLTIERIVS